MIALTESQLNKDFLASMEFIQLFYMNQSWHLSISWMDPHSYCNSYGGLWEKLV